MPSYVTPKINTAFVFYISLEDKANPGLFKASPTLAAGDVLVATGDGAPDNITTLPTVDADFTKRLKVSLSAAEMNGDNVTVIFSDAAGAEWFDLEINLQTTAQQIDDLAATGAAMTLANDAITAAKIAPDAIGSSELATSAITEIAAAISSTAGSGALVTTITVNDANAQPIDGVEVWVTSDIAGTTVVAGTLTTNAAGVVTFMLDAGTYYLWRQLSRYNFTNPTTIVVS